MQKIIALSGIAFVTGLNCFSTKLGAHASGVFLVIKIALLLAIAIIGAIALPRYGSMSALGSNITEGTSNSFGDYAIALYAGLWAYDGWDNMNYVSAEMKNARRDLPRVIHIAMPVVIFAYLLSNISYFAVLSREEILGTTTVALSFATKLFGPLGRIVFALLISISCIGALNATVFASARLVYSSAEEGFIPAIFSKLNSSRGTPINALLLQAMITSGFVCVGEFSSLVTFYGVAGYLFYFLTVFGVIVLRIKEPDLDRPYRTILATPILFCCVALFLVSRTVFETPIAALFVALFIASGCPIYMWKFGLPFKRRVTS
jgi:amino acid transporter